jgi:hypothetical protein
VRFNSFFQASKIIICAGLFAGVAAGCAIVDDVGIRTSTMNRAMAAYNNDAILLNIVRASQYEPLNFVAVTQGSPNLSLVGNIAVPGLTFNPYHLATSTINGNTASATASNSMQVQPLDDPGSWQAMLTPLDVATIGFFIKQGYPRELLLRLFIDRLMTDGKQYVNDPSNPEFYDFQIALANLVLMGFTVEVEKGAPKSGQNPTSRICLNKTDAEATRHIVERLNRTLP